MVNGGVRPSLRESLKMSISYNKNCAVQWGGYVTYIRRRETVLHFEDFSDGPYFVIVAFIPFRRSAVGGFSPFTNNL